MTDIIGEMKLEKDPIITKGVPRFEVHGTDNMVDHPNHYQGSTIEVIEIIEEFNLNFNMGNAIKYILRADYKEDDVQDLKKALWYIKREIEYRES